MSDSQGVFFNLPHSWSHQGGCRLVLSSGAAWDSRITEVEMCGNELHCSEPYVVVGVEGCRVFLECGEKKISWLQEEVFEIRNRHGVLLWTRGARSLDYRYAGAI